MAEPSATKLVRVTNPNGLHARPADLFVQLASQFDSNIQVCRGSNQVDGKSILGILTLAAEEGTELRIDATGEDADAAIAALVGFVENGFEETQTTE